MKKVQPPRTLRLFSLLALLMLPFLSLAQSEQQLPFAVVDFMKVEPGDEDNYLKMEQEVWKHLHQERVNRGLILGWYLYQINFTGTNSPYNYATVAIFPTLNKVENSLPEEIFQAAIQGPLAGQEPDKILEETNKTRQLVSSYLLYQMAAVTNSSKEPAPFIEVDYMHITPETEASYLELEKEVWKPIHKALIDMGYEASWSAWGVRFPGGYGAPFQYATVNAYGDFTNIGPLPIQEAFKAAHPQKDYNKAMEQTEAARSMIKTELWRLVDYVQPAAAVAEKRKKK